jgi:RecB family exonuclease
VITPRTTRLFRVRDLAAYRATLTRWIVEWPFAAARDTCVVVPTRAAAEQLRRTVEDRALERAGAIVWPILATRHDLYLECASRLPAPPALLSAFEREVMLSAVSRERAEEGLSPPFDLRPGLIAEMLALYDQVRRLGRRVDDFERNLNDELEPARDSDRGAAQLLDQTRFLAATFRGYEERLADLGRSDEHALRAALIETPAPRPLARVVVTIADRLADPDGYWPADLDLLTRLPRLESLDLLCTEATLGAGYLERLHAALPDLEEIPLPGEPRPLPVLVTVPGAKPGEPERPASIHRDREEELIAAARRVKREHRQPGAPPLHRTALVVRRPLPYLYLARDVFADARIPFETLDTLPLAAEPYAAALDVALDAVASDFTRGSLLTLLRSPHFRFAATVAESDAPAPAIPASAIAAFDVALADARYLGGLERLEAIAAGWLQIETPATRDERRQDSARPALSAILPALRALAPLGRGGPIVEQIETLLAWLDRFDRALDPGNPDPSRRARVRGAVLGALRALGEAYAHHDAGARADVTTLTAAIRRWLGAQTFAARTGEAGLQIVDAQAARYAEFDDLQIVGLIDGEWPERLRRNVLYPASLLALLEPLPAIADPTRRERDALLSARAAFRDLAWSPARSVRLSTFALENDAVVEPSLLIDEVPTLGLTTRPSLAATDRVLVSEALALDPVVPDAATGVAHAWALARARVSQPEPDRFRGEAGAWRMPRVSVSRLERYLDCPFRFFASEVLRLEEQPEDEDTRTPLERGRFLHELWEKFFGEWQRRGRGRIRPDDVAEARALFEEFCEEALAELSPSEAVLERARLLGSAVGPGIAHRVFAMEADRPAEVTERLIEFPLQGDFTFRAPDGRSRTVTLSAKTDRIDVLAGGALRVIDYKSKKTPDLRQALQLPIYSFVALQALQAARGGQWTIGEALYLSFEGDKSVVLLRARGRTTDELIDDAQERLLDTLEDIARGTFPPRPAKRNLCGPCPYRAVCRLEIVEPDPEPTRE